MEACWTVFEGASWPSRANGLPAVVARFTFYPVRGGGEKTSRPPIVFGFSKSMDISVSIGRLAVSSPSLSNRR